MRTFTKAFGFNRARREACLRRLRRPAHLGAGDRGVSIALGAKPVYDPRWDATIRWQESVSVSIALGAKPVYDAFGVPESSAGKPFQSRSARSLSTTTEATLVEVGKLTVSIALGAKPVYDAECDLRVDVGGQVSIALGAKPVYDVGDAVFCHPGRFMFQSRSARSLSTTANSGTRWSTSITVSIALGAKPVYDSRDELMRFRAGYKFVSIALGAKPVYDPIF